MLVTEVVDSDSDSMHNANILTRASPNIHRKHHHNIRDTFIFYLLFLLFLNLPTRVRASVRKDSEITNRRNTKSNYDLRDSQNETGLFRTFLPWKVSRGARGYGKILRRFDRKYPEGLNEKLVSLNSDVQPQSQQIENQKNEKQFQTDDPKEKLK